MSTDFERSLTVYRKPTPGQVPPALRDLPRWIGWDYARAPGARKPTKKPRTSTLDGRWTDLSTALAETEQGGGVGFVMAGPVRVGQNRTLFAVDLDGCRDPATGRVAQWARDVVCAFGSYTEVTPSGSGLRIFGTVEGDVPRMRVIRVPEPVLAGDHQRCEIQVFGQGPTGYVTVTGDPVSGSPTDVRDGAAGFAMLAEQYPEALGAPETTDFNPRAVGRPPTLDELDAAVRRRADAAETAMLDSGDWSAYGCPSASEGWYVLERLVVDACAGHLDVAVQWLLERTPWGRGVVEESKDPGRYTNEAWVRADLCRVGAKMQAEIESVFSPIEMNGTPALAAEQRGPFDLLDVFEAVEDVADRAAPSTSDAPPVVSDRWFEPVASLMARDPRPKWLVKGLMEQDTLVALSGAPGSFKSFLAFDIALALVRGLDWHGRRTVGGPVFVIAGEGHGGLARRFQAWSREYEDDLADAKLAVSKHAASFLDDDGFKFVVEEGKHTARLWGAVPRLILIDTLNRNFGPGDENSTADMTKFWARCDTLRRVFPGATVVVCHHVGHNATSRARGSSVLPGTVEAEMIVTRDREKSGRPLPTAEVVFRKMKDAAEPPPFWITTKFVHLGTDEDGDEYGSLVIDRVGDSAPNTAQSELADPQVQADVDAVLHVYRENPTASIREGHETSDVPRRRFSRARDLCVEFGLLACEGSGNRALYTLTIPGQERLLGTESVEVDLGDLI